MGGSERIFGTDGVRGRAGEGWLTPEKVAILGRAAGRLLAREGGSRRAVLGHDGRRSGPELEAALGRGLAAGGCATKSAGLITTPGLAWLVHSGGFDLGGMVSASHNPAADNGIKLFRADGEKLSEREERELERALREETDLVLGGEPPHVDPQLEESYLSYLVETAGRGLDLGGLPLVVDAANGGASHVAPRAFARLGARVTAISAEPDGDNINRDCGSTHPETLQAEVRRQRAALGIALDGDGDRCLLVDERGELVDGDAILALLASHAMRRGAWRDPRLVATVMSNKGLHRALRSVGVEVVTVDVGDRNVVEGLRRERLQLGGEQSGHIVFGPDHFYIGDGVYTALRVLRVLRETGRPLSELASLFKAFPQVLVNVPVRSKPHMGSLPSVAETLRAIEAELGDDGRVLLRYSGTEPLARVMIEGPDREHIQLRARELAARIAAEIGA
jgi:phosphoglucosamine mutase